MTPAPYPKKPLHWPLSSYQEERTKDHEGYSAKAYRCPAGVWTIGWGHTGKGVVGGLVWDRIQAEEAFIKDLWDMALGVTFLLTRPDGSIAPTSPRQFDALVDFAFNEGLDIDADTKAEGLGDSTLLKRHLAGDWQGCAREFSKWVYAHTPSGLKKLPGLVDRRREEADWYLSGSPK